MIFVIFLFIFYPVSIILLQTTFFECRVKNKIGLALLLLTQGGVAIVTDKLGNLIIEEYIYYILCISCMCILPVVCTKGSLIKRFICAFIHNVLFLISIVLINTFAIMCCDSELLEGIYFFKDYVLMMLIPYFIILLIQARICYVVNERRISS